MRKTILLLGVIAAGFAALIFMLMAIGNAINSAPDRSSTSYITVEEVEPGIRCAWMVVAGTAAIDCWKVP